MNKQSTSRSIFAERRAQHLLFDDIFLQPWFVSKEIASAICHLIPDTFLSKMRFYFEDWGCLVCGKKNGTYMSNGMCSRCVNRIRQRLLSSLERRGVKTSERSVTEETTGEERVRSARTLLRDLVRREWHPNRMKFRRISWVD